MSNLKTTLIAAGFALASLGAYAQTATPRIDQRAANQQQRIAEGAASGQLTPRETHRLEKQQTHIERAKAKAKADGHVSRHERRHLAKMQKRASKRIHQQRHDARTAG